MNNCIGRIPFVGKVVKAAYLTPLINAVQFGVERKIDVKASRIIAGENAEETNALLQVSSATHIP